MYLLCKTKTNGYIPLSTNWWYCYLLTIIINNNKGKGDFMKKDILFNENKRIVAMVGLGYVGLSLANLFAKVEDESLVICFDISKKRVNELNNLNDHNKILNKADLKNPKLFFTHNADDLKKADFFIISVPTSITEDNLPDLKDLESASLLVGKQLKKGDIVVYESTVYPGVTEDFCIPILEKASNLKSNRDFFVGYSPERVNVGDDAHTIANTKKIVSAQNGDSLEVIKRIYGSILDVDLYPVTSIKVAEAAKLLENVQRDLNISLMNEFSIVLHKLGLDSREIISAASSKWNFVPFAPGLVGGHCIGVDPYYFTYLSQHLNIDECLISSARKINNYMSKYIVEQLVYTLIHRDIPIKGAKVAVMGFAFKEDSTDLRNTQSFNIIKELEKYGINVSVCDPVVDKIAVKEFYNIELVDESKINDMDAIIFAVKHLQFRSFSPEFIMSRLNKNGVLMDIKWIWHASDFSNYPIAYWCL